MKYQEKRYSYGPNASIAQCLATFVVSLTYFEIGILVTTPTIISGYVLNSESDGLSLNEEEVSWFGSIPFLLQPAGVLIGIWMQGYMSQRYSLWISNVLGLACFVTLHYATSASIVLLSSVWMALSLGLTEPSGMNYISEYSEVRLRGFLCSSTLTAMSLGMLFELCIVPLVNWRTGLLICATIPLFSLLLLTLIPDSPIWLLSKGRRKDALKALTWLRGRVESEVVEEEFSDLNNFVYSKLTYDEITEEQTRPLLMRTKKREPTFSGLLSGAFEKRTMYPLLLLGVLEGSVLFAASAGARTYAINLFDALEIQIDEGWLTLTMAVAMALGNIFVVFILKYTGKRMLSLVAIGLAAFTSICLGIYVHYKDELQMPWIFIVLLFILCFESAQASVVPWMMIGEVFPLRTRHIGSGLSGALFDVLLFVFTKTYFTVDEMLGTEMYFVVNGIVAIIGCIYLYAYLPETEGKSLAEIEEILSKKFKT